MNQEDIYVIFQQYEEYFTEKINLSHNEINRTFIPYNNKNLCLFNGFVNVRYINLSYNPIEKIDPASFSSNTLLETLILENTDLSKEHNLRFSRFLKSI